MKVDRWFLNIVGFFYAYQVYFPYNSVKNVLKLLKKLSKSIRKDKLPFVVNIDSLDEKINSSTNLNIINYMKT